MAKKTSKKQAQKKQRQNKQTSKGKSRSARRQAAGAPTLRGQAVAAGENEARIAQLRGALRKDPANLRSAIALADLLGRVGRESEIPDTLQPFEDAYPMESSGDRREFNRLLAVGYAHQDRCLEAEDVIRRALADEQESLDLYYVQAYAKLTMREYEAVIEACSQYVAMANAVEQGALIVNDFAATRAHTSQLYNFLGSAFKELGRQEEAAEAFRRAITYDPGNYLPHLNLVNLLISQKKTAEAREFIRLGLKNCRQVQELRMLAQSVKRTATVSACMIVKNEEEMLPDCLESIRDWVDEIIVVDTGSTDRTVEIAREYGARLYFQEWEGNFSKHRNYSLEQATGDWIFIIDADERFMAEDVRLVRDAVNADDYSVLSINVFNVYKGSEERTTFLPSTRLWRRDLNLRYEGIVHNVLRVPENISVHRLPARLKHLGYDLSREKMAKKAERTSCLLEKQLAENPDNAFSLFNYAQLLAGQRDDDSTRHADRIIDMAQRAVDLTAPDNQKNRHIHLMCLNHLAWTHFFVGRFDEAERFANRALTAKADYLDPLLLLGHIAARQNKLEEAEPRYRRYLDAQASYDASREVENLIINHVDSRVNAYYALATIAEINRRRDDAKHHYRHVLEIDPMYLDANGAMGRLALSEGDQEAARQYFDRQTQTDTYSRESWLGLGRIAEHAGDLARAEQCYRKILEHDTHDSEASKRLAEVCRTSGRTNEAAAWHRRLGDAQDAGPTEKRESAASLFALGRYQEAAEAYAALVRENPDSETLNDLGNCYFKLEEYDTAARHYRQAVDCQPVAVIAWRNLGLAEARLQNLNEAIAALERFLAAEPDDQGVLSVLADLHSHGGDFHTALPLYERLLVKQPRSVEILFRLSECYLHMGHRDSAIIGYQRVLEIDPGFKPAQQRINELAVAVSRA